MLGNIQVEVLRHLHNAKHGIPVEEFLGNWKYKDGGLRSIAGLERRGFIRVNSGTVYFVRFPTEIEMESGTKTFTIEELEEFDEISRRNLVYLYRRELEEVERGHVERVSIPEGVRRSLKRLGVIKWKILDLTDLGHKLLGEVMCSGFT
jgi:hypothetical protein